MIEQRIFNNKHLRWISYGIDHTNTIDFAVIKFTIKQFLYFGIHLGHLKKNSEFLAAWIFYGWRNNIFIINLIKTIIRIKIGLKMVKKVSSLNLSFLFVSMNKIFAPYIARYALLCGEPYNIYYWISGSLCNSKYVLSWHHILKKIYYKKSFKIRHKDRKRLLSSYGFNETKIVRYKSHPKAWFDVPKYNNNIIREFLKSYLKNVNITSPYKKKYKIFNFNEDWKYDPKTKRYKHPYIADHYIDYFSNYEEDFKSKQKFKLKSKKKVYFGFYNKFKFLKNDLKFYLLLKKYDKFKKTVNLEKILRKQYDFITKKNKKYYNKKKKKRLFLLNPKSLSFLKIKDFLKNKELWLKKLKRLKNVDNFVNKLKNSGYFITNVNKFDYLKMIKKNNLIKTELNKKNLKIFINFRNTFKNNFKIFDINEDKFFMPYIDSSMTMRRMKGFRLYKKRIRQIIRFKKAYLYKNLINKDMPYNLSKNILNYFAERKFNIFYINNYKFFNDWDNKELVKKSLSFGIKKIKHRRNYLLKQYLKSKISNLLIKQKNFFKKKKVIIKSDWKLKIRTERYFNKNLFNKSLFNLIKNKKKSSIMRKKLLFLKNFNINIYNKIILNLKFLHTRTDWLLLKKCNRFTLNMFFKYYFLKQNNIINYFSKNINFVYLDYFIKNLKYLKNKEHLLKNNNKLIFNIIKSDLNTRNKLKIFNFFIKINRYLKNNDKTFMHYYNENVSLLNNNKLNQLQIIFKSLKNNMQRKQFMKLIDNLSLLQKKKVYINKFLINKNLINSLKKKDNVKYYYKFKKKLKIYKKKVIDKKFFKNFLFLIQKHQLTKYRRGLKVKKWRFLRFKRRFGKRKRKGDFPGGGFIPTVLDNVNIIDEFGLARVPFISLVDSDVKSVGIFIPIPSNDDSLQCINFFSYLISKTILISKYFFIKNFDKFKDKFEDKLFNIKYKFVFLNYLKSNKFRNKSLYLENEFKNHLDYFFLKILNSKAVLNFNFEEEIKYNMFLENEGIYSIIDNKIHTTDLKVYKL